MDLKPIEINLGEYPENMREYLTGAKIFDSSCSEHAKVIFIDKKDSQTKYFLKSDAKYGLKSDALVMNYFSDKNLSGKVIDYVSSDVLDKDFLLMEQVTGEDGTSRKFLDHPEKLTDIFAESLVKLHSVDISRDKNILTDKIQDLFAEAEKMKNPSSEGSKWLLEYIKADNGGDINCTREYAYNFLNENKYKLKSDVLIHGDYCLPNILLNDDFSFSGFIDIGFAGIGERHYDIWWGVWTLEYNLKTNAYKHRFIECYNVNIYSIGKFD
ncbi:MAG: phosphotransferase [Oscillospiraceae bacterium]|nr:phosphotransferase [Oscillospiraceae bacterium]